MTWKFIRAVTCLLIFFASKLVYTFFLIRYLWIYSELFNKTERCNHQKIYIKKLITFYKNPKKPGSINIFGKTRSLECVREREIKTWFWPVTIALFALVDNGRTRSYRTCKYGFDQKKKNFWCWYNLYTVRPYLSWILTKPSHEYKKKCSNSKGWYEKIEKWRAEIKIMIALSMFLLLKSIYRIHFVESYLFFFSTILNNNKNKNIPAVCAWALCSAYIAIHV